MALTSSEQLRYWGIGVGVFLVLLYFLGGALAPYLVGAGMAYLLDPVADRLERLKMSRLLATIVIMLVMLLLFLVSMLVLVPFLADQAQRLSVAVPDLIDRLRAYLIATFPEIMNEESGIRQALSAAQDRVEAASLTVLNTVLSSSLAVLDFVFLVVVAPVVAFYLLLDWDRMIAKIDSWLPRDHAPTIRRLAGQIDATLNSFLRGQLTVMLFLAAFYSIGLAIVGLNFGVAVGMFAGAVSFIPYVGTFLGGALAIGISIFQFWGEWQWIIAVAVIFGAGQFIEGNILTPKLVGDSVGLHPVALMFALSAFGLMFGFVGLLIAVPVSASIGVLARFALDQYLQGRLYRGLAGQARPEDEAQEAEE